VRRLYRDPGNRLVAGVASGIAGHLGIPSFWVRIGFIALLPFGGYGALMYAVFWAVLSMPPGAVPARRDRRQLLPFLALTIGILLIQWMAGLSGGSSGALGWFFAVIAIGAGIIWHLADPTRRRRPAVPIPDAALPQRRWLGAVLEETDRRSYLIRIVGGGTCVIIGIIGIAVLLRPNAGVAFPVLLGGLVYALVSLAGVALVIAPLLWRTFGQLRAERVGRIREQERAEIAAMVHDQVLHTLALIQRKSTDAKEVVRLARGQERSLRNWLYKPTALPTERFSAAVEEVVAEVEDTYAVVVESVVVGDVDVNERVAALVAAAREALVNAARHAKVTSVSLYAEVEAESMSVFVRDRGVGFDLTEVGPDRHGVRGSIMGRMERHGGTAEIRSEPGSGTEVRLRMPTPEGRERHG
jgi:phage shock protein PspC (stress-responsive transcriptional regulator)/anti-sigma regulatory factor (Ser/Thr protein kinase)